MSKETFFMLGSFRPHVSFMRFFRRIWHLSVKKKQFQISSLNTSNFWNRNYFFLFIEINIYNFCKGYNFYKEKVLLVSEFNIYITIFKDAQFPFHLWELSSKRHKSTQTSFYVSFFFSPLYGAESTNFPP